MGFNRKTVKKEGEEIDEKIEMKDEQLDDKE